jgi:hypothetical protein
LKGQALNVMLELLAREALPASAVTTARGEPPEPRRPVVGERKYLVYDTQRYYLHVT